MKLTTTNDEGHPMKHPISRKNKDAPAAKSSDKPAPARTVLLAVSGSSPAIITEAIWALAQETPPVIPDCVVAVTTASGARALESQLLTPVETWGGYTVWRSLRQTILGSGYTTDQRLALESPAIITRVEPGAGVARPLEDIRDIQDNAAAAETILATVRRFSTDPEVRLLGLLSGGRWPPAGTPPRRSEAGRAIAWSCRLARRQRYDGCGCEIPCAR